MRNIGWCLDRIQIVIARIPRAVNTPEEKTSANKILDEVHEYSVTLAQIIQNPGFRDALNQLENSSISEVKLQADQIEELAKDLNHRLQVLDLYIQELRDIIINRPQEWARKADQIVLMIDQKFGGERGNLRAEFQVALHEEEQLRALVTAEKHLEEFLKL